MGPHPPLYLTEILGGGGEVGEMAKLLPSIGIAKDMWKYL